MDEDKVLAALARIEERMAEGFTAVDARMTGLRSELQGEITELRVAVMGKFEQVQNELTAIRSDLTVSANAAMRAVKRTDGDREDMKDLNELVTSIMVSLRILRTEVDELKGRKG